MQGATEWSEAMIMLTAANRHHNRRAMVGRVDQVSGSQFPGLGWTRASKQSRAQLGVRLRVILEGIIDSFGGSVSSHTQRRIAFAEFRDSGPAQTGVYVDPLRSRVVHIISF